MFHGGDLPPMRRTAATYRPQVNRRVIVILAVALVGLFVASAIAGRSNSSRQQSFTTPSYVPPSFTSPSISIPGFGSTTPPDRVQPAPTYRSGQVDLSLADYAGSATLDGDVFVTTRDRLTRLHPTATGFQKVWDTPLGGFRALGVVATDDAIYTLDDSTVAAYRPDGGSFRWVTPITLYADSPRGEPIAVVGNVIIRETRDHDLVAYGAASSTPLWHRKVAESARLLPIGSNGLAMVAPVSSSSTALRIDALDVDTGKRSPGAGSRPECAPADAAPGDASSRVAFGGQQTSVGAIPGTSDLVVAWSSPFGACIARLQVGSPEVAWTKVVPGVVAPDTAAPLVDGGYAAFVGSAGIVVVGLDGTTTAVADQRSFTTRAIAIQRGTFVTESETDGGVLVQGWDPKSGVTRWHAELGPDTRTFHPGASAGSWTGSVSTDRPTVQVTVASHLAGDTMQVVAREADGRVTTRTVDPTNGQLGRVVGLHQGTPSDDHYAIRVDGAVGGPVLVVTDGDLVEVPSGSVTVRVWPTP